jgi:uncharacterized repeat protein (TIGR02543 family)
MKNIKIKSITLLLITCMLLLMNVSCNDDNDNAISYKVTVVSNGGTNFAPIYVKAGQCIPLNKLYPAPIIDDGGTFDTWCGDNSLSKVFDFTTPITKDTTLYARFSYVTHTVSFVMNGAPDVQSVQVRDGRTLTVDNPTYSGHTFVYWYMDKAFTQPYNMNNPIKDDLTLYARWAAPSPSSWFTIDGNGTLVGCTPPAGTETVVVPDGVKAIGQWMVLANGITSVKEFILPESVESIGTGAFKDSQIVSFIMPSKVKELNTWTFVGCNQLKSFLFAPNSHFEKLVSDDGNNSVIGASALTSIIFPPSFQYFGRYTMVGCTSLKTMTLERSESAVTFYSYLQGGGVWLWGGYFPEKIRVPAKVKDAFIAGMKQVMQEYELGKMSAITETY